ncbi:SDR family NAD(P)-dependent oxidoreductase, partial [Klebsiella aerogenes]|uniref:SDR family NAD(P)-dependent oxidoreductase n=1 Tax=Klebsiella aerogenes TaxID=548 RepID=UPI003D05E5D4
LTALQAAGATVIGQGTASGIPADFADPAAPRALWDAALAAHGGRIDVLINNAGVFEANPITRDDAAWVAEWERTIRINLTAAA